MKYFVNDSEILFNNFQRLLNDFEMFLTEPERATNPKQIIEKTQNENHQKHVILEGFRSNGH